MLYNACYNSRERVGVTVCVAAVCEGNIILGASDRMLTAADIQFEPEQSKIITVTNSIAVMVSGDSAVQAEILQALHTEIGAWIAAHPKTWVPVYEVADLYRRGRNQVRFRQAEGAILAPLGLDGATFLTKQREMDPQLVRQLATELINADHPAVSAIIAGVDTTGAHIFVVEGPKVSCRDTVGFASIGIGNWHADSQFMFAGHTRAKPFPETMLLAYSAKKRAEVAPGVGEATDMFTMGPLLGSYVTINPDVLVRLEEIYQKSLNAEEKAARRAVTSVTKYVEEIIAASTAKTQTAGAPGDGGGAKAADEKGARSAAETTKPAPGGATAAPGPPQEVPPLTTRDQ